MCCLHYAQDRSKLISAWLVVLVILNTYKNRCQFQSKKQICFFQIQSDEKEATSGTWLSNLSQLSRCELWISQALQIDTDDFR